jgi:hypothetical protein
MSIISSSDAVQETKPKITTLIEPSINTDVRNDDKPCNVVDCSSRPISRCTLCSEYYCYSHANEHNHSMDNLEILK